MTHEGNLFIPYAKATLAQVENAINKARLKAREEKNYLRIGFVPVAESKVFPYILPSLRFENSNLKITLHSLCATEQQQALANKEIDIAIVREDLSESGFDSKLILQETLVLLVPALHPLAKTDQITLDHLQDIDLIVPAASHAPTLHELITGLFATRNINIHYIQQAENILFNINSVSMSLGCAILPSYVLPIVKNNPAIQVKFFAEELPKLNLYACFHRHSRQPNILNFLDKVDSKMRNSSSLYA